MFIAYHHFCCHYACASYDPKIRPLFYVYILLNINEMYKRGLIFVAYVAYNFKQDTFFVAAQGDRTVIMDNTFFWGYRKTTIKPEEVVISIHIPFTQKVMSNKAKSKKDPQTRHLARGVWTPRHRNLYTVP